MKIAIVGNMNNNFFAFARYLRDCGLDVMLFVTPRLPEHFQPQCDTDEDVSILDWIKPFPVDFTRFGLLFPNEKVRQLFCKMDLIVAEGLAMAYLQRAGITVDVFVPYGSDLYFSPFWEAEVQANGIRKSLFRLPLYFVRSYWQKRAIRNARVICTNLSHTLYKKAIDKMEVLALNVGFPMLYINRITKQDNYLKELEEYDFIVSNHSRHIWTSNPDCLCDFNLYGGNKRNDRLFRAFASFLKTTKFCNPLLITFEYGCDVEQSKKLACSLGIEDRVKWFPKSERRFILKVIASANLGVDQLREGISGIGGTGYELMASGVPLLTHTNGALKDNKHPFYNAPIIDVLTEEDLLKIFHDYEKFPEKYIEIGKKSKEWFDNHLGKNLAKKYALLLRKLYANKSLTTEDWEISSVFLDK